MNQSNAHLAAQQIKTKNPNFTPKIGIILGSGLGDFAKEIENSVSISYADLPGFPSCSVHGHAGNLIMGSLTGVDIICLQGRAHSYEGNRNDVVKTYIRTLKLLGCDELIITNATGSLREEVGPGEIVLITDHINMQSGNPLIGENDDDFGPRFFPLDTAYDLDMRQNLLRIAGQNSIALHQGVYLAVNGPNYETAAEIRAFKLLGADVVGMSTVPEVLVGTHCGMKLAVLSIISNFATGLTEISHNHEDVVITAATATKKLTQLLKQFIGSHAGQEHLSIG
ncbi:MAG: purine-nucleoside phosphorylase [Legionellaceae bacterium]|nr:purine-nucleoside phosphorylase [Legionellaceae bacterium]